MEKIAKDEILNSIKRANPWWESSAESSFEKLPKRTHFKKLYELTKQKSPVRALVLMGTRRIGKTVLLYQIIAELIKDGSDPKQILYLSLDNPVFRLNRLEEFFLWGADWAGTSKDEMTVFFDEIQYLDNWEQQLKVLVDAYPETKFVVTGSAAAALNKSSKESGAGRFTNYLLPPLSFYEYVFIKGTIEKLPNKSIDLAKLNELYLEYLNFGGFPEAISEKKLREQPELYIGQDILDKVLGRDLPSIFGITNPNELHKLFASLAYNTSNEVSLDGIASTAGVSKADINKYLSFLEAAFLIWVVEKTDNKLKNFQRRTHFKIVLTNPSLRSAIFGKLQADAPALEGLAETAVYSQLRVFNGNLPLYKYAKWSRGGSKGEVDLVRVGKDDTVKAALEIKWSDQFANGKKPKSLISFCKTNSLEYALMSSKTIFSETTFDRVVVHHYPTSYLCFVLGIYSGILDTIHNYTTRVASSKDPEKPSLDERVFENLVTDVVASRYLKEDLLDRLTNAFQLMRGLFQN
jgi:uncharacterized protein